MKKVVYVCILFIAIVIAFVAGMVVGKGNNSHDSVVGVYQTDSWNGKIGTLVLYEDGTCQYPSGGSATWKSDGNTIHITLESNYSIQDGSTSEHVSTSEYEAEIMENGLVLHGAFFEKVSD